MGENRFFIIGASGSGKSTVATSIADHFGIPHYDLDDIYWEKKYTVKRSQNEQFQLASELAQKDSWVIEGIYTDFTDEILKRATYVVWLDLKLSVLFVRIIRRYLNREKIYEENIRTVSILINEAIIKSKFRNGMYCKIRSFLTPVKNRVTIIKNQKQLDEYLEKILNS